MYRPSTYPHTLALPSLRNCLLAFVAGILLAWLHSTGLLLPALVTLFALSFGAVGIFLACIAVGGKADR